MLLAGSLLFACTSAPTEPGVDSAGTADSATIPGRLDLVDPELWTQLDADEDPFADHRPDEVICDEDEGLTVETGLFEVDTTFCNYASVAQPTLADVAVDDEIQVLVYHGALSSSDEGEAHVALMLGDQLVWEQLIAIPSGSGVYSTDVGAAFEAPVGTRAVFHLHNHGNNTWNLGHFRRER